MKAIDVAWALLLALSFPSFSRGNDKQLANNRDFQYLLAKEAGNALFDKYRTALWEQDWSALNFHVLNGSLGVSLECLSDLDDLKSNTMKMLKYIDAAGRPRSGILRGNRFWMGSVNECQEIPDSQYIIKTLHLEIPVVKKKLPPISWGACYPKCCSSIHIYQLLQFTLAKVDKPLKVSVQYTESILPEKAPYSTGVKATLGFCGVLLFLCLLGTLVDWGVELYQESAAAKDSHHLRRRAAPSESYATCTDVGGAINSSNDHVYLLPPTTSFQRTLLRLRGILEPIRDFLLCFSLVRNTGKIFQTNVSATAITSINGIRVLSIAWVILGNTFMAYKKSPLTENRMGLQEDSKLFTMMPVVNAFYSIDSFFFLSGLLMAYSCLQKIEKSGGSLKFNWLMFYVHRFWRLTPPYMFVIVFSMYLQRFLSTGPLWVHQYKNKLCADHWWANLLYINNFYPTDFDKECIRWSWYLANEMQFFVIAPLLLIIVYRFGWRGFLVLFGVLLSCTAVTAVLYGHYDLDPLAPIKNITHSLTPERVNKLNDYENIIYIKPYCRVQPYLVGFILGYSMYRNNRPSRRPGWIVILLGWAAATVAGVGLVYGPRKSVNPGAEEWNLASRVVFGALERLLWSLVLAWVTYACHYKAGGLAQKFLSAKFWIPLSRLTYSVYLLHIIVLTVMFGGADETIYYDFFTAAYYFIAAVVLSYAAAFILAVTIEFPCDSLENMVVKYFGRSPCWNSE